jgi:hypothetical protein
MKKLPLLATALLLVASAANAKDCIKVDDDPSPVGVLSGQLTHHHKVVNPDLRAAEGPFLKPDAPLLIDFGGVRGCTNFAKVVILNGANKFKDKQRVTISGTLGRFGSALVDPPIFIDPAQ